MGVRLAGALESAHRVGTLHRDIKPANILMSDYGEAQLTDFGIARIEGGFETATGAFTGSLSYSAPEVLNGNPPTAQSDIYGLGAALFSIIAGRAAFERRDGEEIIAQFLRITGQPIPDLRGHGVPDQLCAVLERAMAKDPADRPASAEAFGSGAAGGAAQSPATTSPRWPCRRPGGMARDVTETAHVRDERSPSRVSRSSTWWIGRGGPRRGPTPTAQVVPPDRHRTRPAITRPRPRRRRAGHRPSRARPPGPPARPGGTMPPGPPPPRPRARPQPQAPERPGARARHGRRAAAGRPLAWPGVYLLSGPARRPGPARTPAGPLALGVPWTGARRTPRPRASRSPPPSPTAWSGSSAASPTRRPPPSVQGYDAAISSWKDAAPLPVPLHHEMATTYNGQIVVLGGWQPQGANLNADPEHQGLRAAGQAGPSCRRC